VTGGFLGISQHRWTFHLDQTSGTDGFVGHNSIFLTYLIALARGCGRMESSGGDYTSYAVYEKFILLYQQTIVVMHAFQAKIPFTHVPIMG
jgi:hypothetical protein